MRAIGGKMKINSQSIMQVKSLIIDGIKIDICKYNRNDFTEDEWAEFINYDNALYESIYKEPCQTPYEVKRTWFTDVESDDINHRWLLIKNDQLIGRAATSYYGKSSASYDQNKDTAETYIDVHENHRSLGYGSALYQVLLEQVLSDGKKKMQSDYILNCSGDFCRKHGFKIESARNISKLYKKDIDIDKITKWAQMSTRQIEIFNTVPERYLEEFCSLYTSCGMMAPDYDGDYTASEQTTPQARRKNEKFWKEKGIMQYTAVSIEADGNLSGMTEMDYFLANPKHVDQGLTGVLKPYRGHGIGLQLKSKLLLYFLETNPDLEFVYTANNRRNDAMLSINTKMGFKAYYDHYLVSKKI